MIWGLTTSDMVFYPLSNTWIPVTSLHFVNGSFKVSEISESKTLYSDGYIRSSYTGNGILLDKKPIAYRED